MFRAVPTPLACRRQAFPFQNIPLFRQVCAVPSATVLEAPASCIDGSGALVERAGPKCIVCVANSSCFSIGAAAFYRARHCLAVVFCALPSRTDGVGNARVRCAVSKGAVLDADKPAKDLRGVAVSIGAV